MHGSAVPKQEVNYFRQAKEFVSDMAWRTRSSDFEVETVRNSEIPKKSPTEFVAPMAQPKRVPILNGVLDALQAVPLSLNHGKEEHQNML